MHESACSTKQKSVASRRNKNPADPSRTPVHRKKTAYKTHQHRTVGLQTNQLCCQMTPLDILKLILVSNSSRAAVGRTQVNLKSPYLSSPFAPEIIAVMITTTDC